MQHQLLRGQVDALLARGHRGSRLVSTVTPSSLELLSPRPAHRGIERLAVERMHREEIRADARDRRGGALDRRLDIEQLRVDEDAITPRYAARSQE